MRRRGWIVLLLALVPVLATGAEPEAPAAGTSAPAAPPQRLPNGRNPRAAMLWSLLPGAGQIYLGNLGTGIAYAAGTAAFLGGGAAVAARNEDLGRDDEVNVLGIVGQKIWEYSIFSTYRDALALSGTDLRAEGYDDTPTPQLLAAPFTEALSPWVLGPALIGGGLAALAANLDDDGDRGWRSISRVEMFGDDFDRTDATWLYGASAFGVSMGAATAEEGLFRGVLQPMLQNQWGDAPGLWATAGTFGLAHIVGVDGGFNPAGVVSATLIGAYLGWVYDREGNRLAKPIAAHFWYDFMIFGVSFAMDPDDTPFGFNVKYSFE